MNFKRISAGALALTMTAALGANALAADKPEGWTPADGARGPMLISARVNYQHQLFLNDEELDTAAIPAVEGQQLPMRLMIRLSTYLSAFMAFSTKWNMIATRKPMEKLGRPRPVTPWR